MSTATTKTESTVYVGAGWVSPGGTIEGCSHTGHSDKSLEIVQDRYGAEWDAYKEREGQYTSWERFLSHHKQWVRVGGNGKVTDYDWQPVTKLTNDQFDLLWDMLTAARERVTAAQSSGVYGGTFSGGGYGCTEFINNLTESLRIVSEAGES